MNSRTSTLYANTCPRDSQEVILANIFDLFKSKKRTLNDTRQISTGKLLDLWLDSARPCLKPTTFSTYYSICEKHLRPNLGRFSLSELKNEELSSFLCGLGSGDAPLSPATARGVATVLKKVLVFGADYGCTVNPEVCKYAPRVSRSAVLTFTDDEQSKIVSVLTNKLQSFDVAIFICLKTGLRLGEICALKWGDINLDRGMLSVCRTISRIKNVDNLKEKTVLYVGEPKTLDSCRKIPLPNSLLEVLRQNALPDDFYVASGAPNKPTEPRTMQRRFKTVLSKAGVRDINFHVLRHTFATKCVERGFDIKSLSMILGHSDVNITLNTYVHPSYERLRSMMTLMD